MQDIAGFISNETILLFDLDGTLVDTDYANFVSYRDAIKKVKNIDLIFDPLKRYDRSSLVCEYPHLSLAELEEIISLKEINYSNNLYLTKVNERVSEVLNIYSLTHKTVLVTNCRENRAEQTLKHHNLQNQFDTCFFRDSESDLNKFQNAINLLKVKPGQVIVFENDLYEIENAHIAGIPNKNIIRI